MRIALLAPLPPEKNGIADYAGHFKAALEAQGITVVTPLAGCVGDLSAIQARIQAFDWSEINVVHAELGGGRLAEFEALRLLRRHFPHLPLTATVHDPERLVWRRAKLPWPLTWAEHLPSPLPEIATVLSDPLTLREERQVAQSLNRLITLTQLGADCLSHRMRLKKTQVQVIAHGNLAITPAPLPALDRLRLLYFGFIYRGKGIEDLLHALAQVFVQRPALKNTLRLTLAGGTAAQMAFAGTNSYLTELQALIARLQLCDSIDWRLDLPGAQIPELIQMHHVMVLPYRESQKLSLLGAQRGTSGALSWAAACGRGAITSDARAFAEEVAHGNGARYPQGNVGALTEQLLQLANHPEQALHWAKRATAIGQERLWCNTATRFAELFAQVAQESADET